MSLNNVFFKRIRNNDNYRNILIILCTISFIFLWDIKLNLYKNFIISTREIFYVLFVYLLLDYERINKKKYILITLFFFIFFLYNYFIYDVGYNLLSIKYNIVPLFLLLIIFLICIAYQKDIIKNLQTAFLIFIYIFMASFFFSDIDYLSFNEKKRLCGILNFRIINQNIFLEPSHLGMVLVPFYYYIFKINKIGLYQKLFLLIFLSFIFVLFYSVTLLFSVIICFILMLLIDFRFFLKNKLFFLCQLLILLTPLLKSGCIYKVNHTLENFTNINNEESRAITFLENEKFDFKNIESVAKKIDERINEFTFYINKIDQKLIELEGSKSDFDKKLFLKSKTEINKYIELRKNLYKENFSLMLESTSAAQMNHLIRKNVLLFPINNDRKINDHSTAVLLNAINVAFLSIKEKPFGWGFNNYQRAFNQYMLKEINPPFLEIYYLNYNDASNNFIKLIVEFGIFSIFIFIYLIHFTLNKKVPASQRILISGIIATQMLRAAGYFNGGFILFLMLAIIINYKSFKNEE